VRGAALQRRLAAQSPQAFIDDVLVRGLGVRYVLVGDDFRFGAKRAGDYAMLDAAGRQGFDVARMNSYEVHGLRVSSSAVREALAAGRHGRRRARCWAGPTASAAMWCTAASWAAAGRNGAGAGGRLSHAEPALFATGSPPPAASSWCRCMAWPTSRCRRGQPGRAPLARPERRERRPRAAGNPLPALAAAWAPEGAYGKIIRVELLHKLHDELSTTAWTP
jgi:riboflavin kinase/FMN adenylyltransferase